MGPRIAFLLHSWVLLMLLIPGPQFEKCDSETHPELFKNEMIQWGFA